MSTVVQLVTEPASEPLTLDEAKLHLRLEITEDDDLVSALISAARRVLETHCKRSFIATTYDALGDFFPSTGGYLNRDIRQQMMGFSGLGGVPTVGWLPQPYGILELPKAPLLSVTSITYYDTSGTQQTLDPANYVVELGIPGRISPTFGTVWPVTLPRIGAITVRFVTGYGEDATTVPANVKAAMKLLIGNWYENRESSIVGTSAVDLPNGVEALMSPEMWGAYG